MSQNNSSAVQKGRYHSDTTPFCQSDHSRTRLLCGSLTAAAGY